jgi:hypothetical protein
MGLCESIFSFHQYSVANACNIHTTNACEQQQIITNEQRRTAVVPALWMSVTHFPSLSGHSHNKLLSVRHYMLWIPTRALLLILNIVDTSFSMFFFVPFHSLWFLSLRTPVLCNSFCNLAVNVKKIMQDGGLFTFSRAPLLYFIISACSEWVQSTRQVEADLETYRLSNVKWRER